MSSDGPSAGERPAPPELADSTGDSAERAPGLPRRPWPSFGLVRLGRLDELVQAGNKTLPGVDADGLKGGNP